MVINVRILQNVCTIFIVVNLQGPCFFYVSMSETYC